MKGQVFIAGAFMIAVVIVVFTISLPAGPGNVEMPHKKYIAGNIAAEYRHAFESGNVRAFTEHVREKNRNFESVYAAIERNEGGYEIIIGNYMGDAVSLAITATNSEPAAVEAEIAGDSERAFAYVSSGTADVTISYDFPGQSWQETMETSPDSSGRMIYDFALSDSSSKLGRKGEIT